ncbi:MAG: DUF5127 domain-containing protein [Gemmataceae bacterium]
MWKRGRPTRRRTKVAVLFDASTPAVNTPDQKVVWGREDRRTDRPPHRQRDQPVLQKRGDDLRIDWGYLATSPSPNEQRPTAVAPADRVRKNFGRRQAGGEDVASTPTPAGKAPEALAVAFDLGTVGETSRRRARRFSRMTISIRFNTSSRTCGRTGRTASGQPTCCGRR